MTPPIPPGPAPLRYRLSLQTYYGALRLLTPLIWQYFRRRARKDAAYADFPEERRGLGEPFVIADVWVHAVSMGELNSAVPLIRLLLEQGYRVVTTHATPAGRRAAERTFDAEITARRVAVRFAPIDLPKAWGHFLLGTQPKVGLVMEMEFWPGMIEAAALMDIPLCLANSQVPSKSYPRALRLAKGIGHPVARAAAVFAKSERMAERFRALGAGDVRVMGETRFDIPPNPSHVAAGEALKARLSRDVVTLASVVEGEEETYLQAIRAMGEAGAPPLFIWVPRAPELFEATAERLRGAGLRVAVRSKEISPDLTGLPDLGDVDVLLGDSFGEMFFYLAAADAVIVGGGFVEKGAHNVIEPLALGKPVITGPHVWTIEYPGVEAREAGVLTVCDTAEALPDEIAAALRGGGEAARAFHAENAGASQRMVEAILPLLEDKR